MKIDACEQFTLGRLMQGNSSGRGRRLSVRMATPFTAVEASHRFDDSFDTDRSFFAPIVTLQLFLRTHDM